MPSGNKTPLDLAKAVSIELQKQKEFCPNLDLLTILFETMYFTSLKTEEGQSISCDLIWLDPKSQLPSSQMRLRNHHCSFTPFEEPVSFTISNLTKISKTSDPRTSSFVVYPNTDGNLFIWGMVDQCNEQYDYMTHQITDGALGRPGIFNSTILGIGHIAAYLGFAKLGELRISTLITSTSRVLNVGPIRRKLQTAIDQFTEITLNNYKCLRDREHWSKVLEDDWIKVFCRLLLRIQSFKHGGALLITPNSITSGLDVKYRLNYDRLPLALQKRGIHQIQCSVSKDLISEDKKRSISKKLYTDVLIAQNDLADSEREIDGVLWFISLLTRVDGLVLLGPQLDVKGFGVEITHKNQPKSVYIASDAEGTQSHRIDYKHFGTRHRSMMRYCFNAEESIGFVISQDGDLRVIAKLNNQIVMWENISLRVDDNFLQQTSMH